MRFRGHTVDSQKRFPVFYRDQLIGQLIPDLIVDDQLIVDAKVVTTLHMSHIAQMIGYLAITGLNVALLLNFHDAKLEWKRVVR